jgi:selenocysteine-specific elongation factor
MSIRTPSSAQTSATRLAIVGTAGHIDHGKTSMVRLLTGVDTDRLPEEKARGISIDLGFAPLVTPAGVRVGLVDVPGHERFVKNMLAGAGGIDLVLMVIAADEGVMPQTREHLAIVRLLGVERGIVVLSKVDMAERDWIGMVRKDVRSLMQVAGLGEAPIVEFSAVTGAGKAELLAELDRQLAGLPLRAADQPARLPVDRVFVMEGFGTVVTGTLWRGKVKTGETLELLPSGKSVRVRRVQIHGETVDEANAGQRTALALHGVGRDEVARGDWVVAPGSLRASRLLDVRFELLPDFPKEWKNNARVRFHLGASEIIGRLVLLDADAVKPGASALAQLRLEHETVAARGDRFVIRTYSPARTAGGGAVIEPVATRRRRHGGGLEALAVHESGSVAARLLERLAAETRLAATAVLAQAVGESEASIAEALAALEDEGSVFSPVEGRWIAAARWKATRDAIAGAVRRFVTAHPAQYGVMKGELKRDLKDAIEAKLFDAAFDALETDGVLEQRGERVRPADAPWTPPAEALAGLEKLGKLLEANGLMPPENKEWQAALGKDASEITSLGFFLERLVRVSGELTYTAGQMKTLRSGLVAAFNKKPALTMADFKEAFGVSRKYSVPLLEHCDRVGWTVRVGDERNRGGRL